jgi:carbon monoxide dehydrogenase subunit G
MRVERETHIAAPPQRVYDLVMNPERLSDWVSIHDSLEHAPDGQLSKGSELSQRLRLAGRSFTVHWKVVEDEPCRSVTWEGRGPARSRASVSYEFREEDGGTNFVYANEYHLPGGPLGSLAGPAVKRITGKEVDKTLNTLKDLVEKT